MTTDRLSLLDNERREKAMVTLDRKCNHGNRTQTAQALQEVSTVCCRVPSCTVTANANHTVPSRARYDVSMSKLIEFM